MPHLGRRKIFYGWWIVLAGSIATIIHGGAYTYGMKPFFMPLIAEFGWSRAALSGAFSLARLESGLMGPVEGFLIDRFGPRKMMLVGMLLFGTGFMVVSRIDSLLAFYLVFIFLLSIGDSLGTVSSVSTAVGNWFIRKRSRAMGFTMAGIGLGGMTVPFIAWLIEQQGWRFAATFIGIAIWVVGLPLALVMRHKPEQYGSLPDGDGDEPRDGGAVTERRGLSFFHAARRSRVAVERELSALEAMKTRAFWFFSIAFAIRLAVTTGVTLHLIPYLGDIGASPEMAASILAILGLISTVGRVGFGWLGDLFPIRYVVTVGLVLIAVGMFIFASMQSLWQVVPFLIVFAPAYGGQVSLMPALRGEYFGRKAFATIQGCMGMVLTAGTVSGPVFAGYLYDVSGSYRTAFLIFGLASLVAALLALAAKQPQGGVVVRDTKC